MPDTAQQLARVRPTAEADLVRMARFCVQPVV